MEGRDTAEAADRPAESETNKIASTGMHLFESLPRPAFGGMGEGRGLLLNLKSCSIS